MRAAPALAKSVLILVLAAPAVAQQVELEGRVVDQNGKPLSDVSVCLIDRKADPFVTKDLLAQPLAKTGADGRYAHASNEELKESRYDLLFVRRGRVHVRTPLHPKDGWPVVLPRAHVLAGRVVDHEGNPLPDVRVEALDWMWQARYRSDEATYDWLPTAHTAVRTSKSGRFIIPGTLSSGVQLRVGKAFRRSNPFALGEPIELVMPKDGIEPSRSRYRTDGRQLKDNPTGNLLPIRGTTGWSAPPRFGASVQFRWLDKENKRATSDDAYYDATSPIAADGTFDAQLAPGRYEVYLVVPRLFRQGAPDLREIQVVTIAEGQKTLALDLQKQMPVTIRGSVTSSVPAGRLLVGTAVRVKVKGHYYGYANYECALAPVAPDGSFEAQVLPGECTIFVLDMWSGMLLLREGSRPYESGDTPELALQVEAGACDVTFDGEIPKLSWLEVQVPNEWVPNGIDRISTFGHEYTKRIGCMVPPETKSMRLYLPPITTDLWFVRSYQGDLKLPHGEASVEIRVGETTSTTIELPEVQAKK